MTTSSKPGAAWRLLSVSALAVTALFAAPIVGAGFVDGIGATFAHEDEGDGGHSGGSKGANRQGPGGGSHEDGGHDDGGHDDGTDVDGDHGGGSGAGRGGSGHADGVTGAAGQGVGGSGTAGQGAAGRPVWAQEGLPEVELGRLNVVRSPERVLDRAFAEAVATFTPETVAFYSLPFDQMTDKLSSDFRSISMIDSPLQNLALYRDALDGSSILASAGVINTVDNLLAVFLGTASDKTIPINIDTVKAVSLILGHDMDDDAAATLAEKAEAIRAAILEGHG